MAHITTSEPIQRDRSRLPVDFARLGDVMREPPRHIWIEPTDRCNTRCSHCDHWNRDFGEDMEPALYQKIAGTVLGGAESVELVGTGEPLISQSFWQMFEECKARGIVIHTTSNGILLREDDRATKIVRANVHLGLSVDSVDREIFEAVRPRVTWAGFLKTLACLKRSADAAGKERRFHLHFNFVAMRKTIASLPGVVRLAHEWGAEMVCVLPLGGEGLRGETAGESINDAPELVSPAFLEALKLGRRHRVTVEVPAAYWPLIREGSNGWNGLRGRLSRLVREILVIRMKILRWGARAAIRRVVRGRAPRGKAGVQLCTLPWRATYFARDGTVYPCCIKSEKLGDFNRQSWEETWNGRPYRSLRRTIHGWNPTEMCRKCPQPMGINGGDEIHHTRFFSKFRAEAILLSSSELEFGGGFHQLEFDDAGAPSHIWMGRTGVIRLPKRPGARFLRLTVGQRHPKADVNFGFARVNGGEAHHFDTTCDTLHFPLDETRSERAEITLEMELGHHLPPDPRELALLVRSVALLTA